MDKYIDILNTDIKYIKGVGEKRAKLLNKMSIYNIWDALYFFPRAYEDRRIKCSISSAPTGEKCCVEGVVLHKAMEKRIKKNISLFGVYAQDETGTILIKWFTNPNYKINIEYGKRYVFYGKIVNFSGRHEMELETMERADNLKTLLKIVPVYPLTKGLNQNLMRNIVSACLDKIGKMTDIFPEKVLEKYGLVSIDFAVGQMHFPKDFDLLKKARRRLVFEELFVLQMSLFTMRKSVSKKRTEPCKNTVCVHDFIKTLPFTLTDAQNNAVEEILSDLKSEKAMNRLVQGDVGSGKTVVAAAAMYVTYKNGFQSAFMAPTEILAVQHYNTLKGFFGDEIKIALLTGSASGKKKMLEQIKNGEFDIVVGTHAVIEKNVEFKNLALAVTDEQHRFGVNQRASLAKKGAANVLVMSATPIPRTLALILYGDLDITIINSLPKGRQPIDTFCVNSSYRKRAYSFVKKQIDEGRQAYVVCPLVEDSDTLDISSGEKVYESLRKGFFSGYNTAFLHGRMKPKQKDEIMREFKDGNISLLVSTTVIEVGVDVPNANIMVIENAERFGLSQLHQLRGRVGRGSFKSYCILITDSDNEVTHERMHIMTKTNDGFEISQKDLQLRGCGEFFGTRQHGLPELKIANLFTDLDVLNTVQKLCAEILEKDDGLKDYGMLKDRINLLFSRLENPCILN